MGPVVASVPVGLSWLWHDHADEGRGPAVQSVWAQGGVMKYQGINFCDRCGGSLEDGRWLSGVCKKCEAKVNASDRARHKDG